MKYCTQCGSEYQDGVTRCADCPEGSLVDAQALSERHIPVPGEGDTRKFVRAIVADDPMTAEDYARVLQEEHIPVFVRPRRAGTVDVLTTGNLLPWWEIMVGEDFLARAQELLAREKAELEATSADAARAAEEEELETEAVSPPPGAL